jgi:hypothetical protein
MDQRAGAFMFVAADRLTGDPVDVSEPVDPAAHQHRMHGRGRHAELTGDLHRAKPLTPPQPHDLPHQMRWGLGRTAARPRGPISHPGRTLDPVPGGPLRRRAGRDHEHLRRRRTGPAAIDNELGKTQPGARGQRSVSVGHEGLRSVKRFLDSSTSQPEAFACLNDRPTSTHR